MTELRWHCMWNKKVYKITLVLDLDLNWHTFIALEHDIMKQYHCRQNVVSGSNAFAVRLPNNQYYGNKIYTETSKSKEKPYNRTVKEHKPNYHYSVIFLIRNDL